MVTVKIYFNYIQLKSFWKAKEAIRKRKRQPTEWEKILANHRSDKELISKINLKFYKYVKKYNSIAKQ